MNNDLINVKTKSKPISIMAADVSTPSINVMKTSNTNAESENEPPSGQIEFYNDH